MARTISDTVTEISSLRHGIENAAWEEARGKLMAYLRLRGSCVGGDQEEYDALEALIKEFIERVDEGDIYQQETDELTRLREENKKLRVALKPFAELSQHTGSMSDSDGVCVYVEDLHAAAAAMREGGNE